MIKQILYNCEADCTVLIRKPQVISGGGAHPLHPPPRSAPAERGPRLILTLISTSWFGAISTELSRFPPIWLIKIKKKSQKNNFQWSSSFACLVFFLSFSFLFLVRFSSLFFLFFSFFFLTEIIIIINCVPGPHQRLSVKAMICVRTTNVRTKQVTK